MRTPPAVSIVARIPPPALFAATFLMGVWAARALHLHGSGPAALGLIGAAVALAGILLFLSAAGLFALDHTTIIPHGRSSALILRGPYRRTRNPIYVSLVLVYLGVALWMHAWIALALVVLPIAVLGRVIIPMEESQLRERFGSSYADYCQQVRRWL